MKQIAILVMLIALLAVGASALTVTSPTLGGPNQDRVKNVVTTFTITNNDTSTTLTGITYTAGAGANDPKYLLSFSGPATLLPGASGSVTINGTIPLDHSAVNSDLKELAIKIGTVTVSGTLGSAADSASADIMMQAVNQLRIKKARVDCGTKSQSVDDGDRVKNLKPGMDCTLEVEVENQFNDNDNNNQKIGDINFDTVDVNVDSSDSDIDIDEDDNLDSLSAGDKDSVTDDVQIDEEAKDGTVSLKIRVSSRDDNGATHGESRTFRLEVKRLSHDIQIRRLEITPATIDNCAASAAHVAVNVLNQGKRDEKDVAVEATVADLKFAKKIENIELDKDDSTSASFDIPIANDAKPGVYRVDVKTYFDTTAPSNSGSVELKIEGCNGEQQTSEATKPTEQPKTDNTVVVPQVQPSTGSQAMAAPKKKDSSFTDSKAYVGMLAVLIVLIAIGIAAMLFMLWRKKPVV